MASASLSACLGSAQEILRSAWCHGSKPRPKELPMSVTTAVLLNAVLDFAAVAAVAAVMWKGYRVASLRAGTASSRE